MPARPTGATQRETTQAGEKTFEKISFKAHFSAVNLLDEDKALARLFGIGPQLAALEDGAAEQQIAGAMGAAIDAIRRRGQPRRRRRSRSAREVPAHPLHLGPTRVLPVTIDSMTIAEQEYDLALNPTRAEWTFRAVGHRHRPVLGRPACQRRARVLDDRQGGDGDRQPGQHRGQIVDLIPI